MIDDSGQLSLDFIIGFTIFLIAFIFVATLMSGLVISLQSKTIDLDAVAYRTGVILVEDPGEPSIPSYQVEIDPLDQWEWIIPEQKDNIIRFGLALSKDTPNILSRAKVEKFFNTTFFSDPTDYQKRLIFSGEGTYPYYFQITLDDTLGNPADPKKTVGEGNPPQKYGFIKRAVFIKEPSEMEETLPVELSNVSVVFDLPSLYDNNRGPVYWIDPFTENITVILKTSGRVLTNSYLSYSSGGAFLPLPGRDLLPVSIDGNPESNAYPFTVTNEIKQEFPPGYFAGIATKSDQLMITYTFENAIDDVPYTYDYYTAAQSPLTPAILEVRIW